MDNKKMVVHPALTEFALMQAKDWEAVAQERLGVIERLCAEVEALRGEVLSDHTSQCPLLPMVRVSRSVLEFWANDLALHGVGDIETAQDIDALLAEMRND
jgi:hypothetical protein